MSDIAIRVENLSKLYHIGAQQRHDTLRDALMNALPRISRKGNDHSCDPSNSWQENATDLWALRDVSFEVQRGEVLGIIGRNGAGKSTLLKILSRITEPTSGQAEIHGRVGSLLEVGTGFHPELTGRENIYLNGAIIGMKRAEMERRFDEIVAFSEIEKFLDTPVKRYSSGMYVRLAFAVAAHLEPEILLIDEVLAVGDAEFQKRCLGRMESIGHEGRTILFVSHNMNAIAQLCRKVVLLKGGRVARLDDNVSAVIKDYLFDGDSSHLLLTVWTNSGHEFENPYFKPLRFYLCDEHGSQASLPASNQSDTWVQLEGQIEVVDPALTIGYAIYAETGDLLYWSYQTDQSEPSWPRLRKGKCTLRGRIPGRLLNEGGYRIDLIGGLHHREWLFRPGAHVPSIYLTIQGGLSESPYWMAKRPGMIAPVLEWLAVDEGEGL